ncbi:hypothetical protein P8452_19838 [Trifolium repens]|nr:hypothetical protein P8452_19838 [Trifolium repens]
MLSIMQEKNLSKKKEMHLEKQKEKKISEHTKDDEGDDDDEESPQQRTYIDIPIFHNLTHLKLHNSWDLVVQMLHHCPKLESLELSKGQENSGEEPEVVHSTWNCSSK